MAKVFRAHDLHTDETVAVKILHPGSDTNYRRFEREASVLATLRTPGVVRYVAHGRAPDGQPFLAMEWLDGFDLEEWLRDRTCTADEVLVLGCALASSGFQASTEANPLTGRPSFAVGMICRLARAGPFHSTHHTVKWDADDWTRMPRSGLSIYARFRLQRLCASTAPPSMTSAALAILTSSVMFGAGCGRANYDVIDASAETGMDGSDLHDADGGNPFLTEALLAHFPLDETSGSSFVDATGHGYDGSCTACPRLGVPGRSNNAVRFDGTNAIVVVNTINYGPGDQVSVAAWVRHDSAGCASVSDAECYVVAKNQFNNLTPYNLQVTVAGAAELYVGDVGTEAGSAAGTVGDGAWHHLVGTFDGANIALFVDGAMRGTGTGTPQSNTEPLAIGASATGASYRPFVGDIDDVRIYERALSADEVAQLYAAYQ